MGLFFGVFGAGAGPELYCYPVVYKELAEGPYAGTGWEADSW
jgi:hypothetical protein